MSIYLWASWYGVGELGVPKLSAQESAALILLAAALLVFRTFRGRYLLVWILGWLAYFVSHWTLRSGGFRPLTPYLNAISQAEFVLAICLFAAAVLVYTHSKRLMLPLAIISLVLVAYAAARAIYWPNIFALRVGLETTYRLVALVAAFELIRFRWARSEIGPWILSLTLLSLHLEWAPINAVFPPGLDLIIDLMLGVSMLLIVFDDSRMRTRRLSVINALTTTITRAQQYGPMMVTALEELQALMGARAAWFRLLEDGNMVIAQQIGLSQHFLTDRMTMTIDDTQRDVLRDGVPTVLKVSQVVDSARPYLQQEKFHHIVMIPVLGKKAPIGMLTLGSRRRLSYAPDDMEFLATSAHQLGLAVENLRLVEQIVRSHRQWSNTFDSIHDVVLLHDAEFKVMKANRALLQRLNQSSGDIVGNPCEAVLPHEHANWNGCPYCKGSEIPFYEGPDPCFGGFVLVSTSTYSEQNGTQKGTIHVVRDATERHVAEEKYRLLFEQMQEGVFVATTEGKLLDCNDAFMRMLGYSNRDELMSLNVDSQLYASAEKRDEFRREVEQHNYVRNFEVVLRRRDGSLLTAMENSFASRDLNGRIERYQGFLLDMTEKKRAEDEIRRRNRELNALNAMAVIATQSFDLDEILNLTLRQVVSLLGAETGSIYLASQDEATFRRRAGWGQRSADRAKFSEVTLPDFGDLVMRSRTEVITPDFLPHLPENLSEFIRADGFQSWIWVLLWGKEKPIGIMGIGSGQSREYSSNDESLLVAIGRQLATTVEKVRLYEETCRAYEDLRRTQEQLLQSEKMSAVGQLIAGVAHELNNPLTAILGYAQLLESEGLQDRAADFVGKLFKQAQRTHRVVQNLLSFARQRKPQKQQVDLRKVLDETLTLRDYDLKVNDIDLVKDYDPNVKGVTADPHQLEQVFLNIINNAVDAILEQGNGGALTVRVLAEGSNVHAVFEDSGPGIKEPNRIFDPFYTTKTVGKGTGLGLSICYGIIKEHGGDISAHNRPEGGAIVDIKLPAAERATFVEEAAAPPKREFALEGRVLLVEEEEAVLEFERDVLTGAGARVTAVTKRTDAEVRLRSEEFDAVIADGKMPGGWTAPEIYRWLKENRPGLERHLMITFSSVAEPETRKFLQENNVPSLAKPFEVADLIAQARKLLQKSKAAGAD